MNPIEFIIANIFDLFKDYMLVAGVLYFEWKEKYFIKLSENIESLE